MTEIKNFFTLKEFRLLPKKFQLTDNVAKMIKANESWIGFFYSGTEEYLLGGEIYRVLEKDGSETLHLIEYEVLEGNPKAGHNKCKVKCIPRGPVELKEEIKDKPGYFTIHRNIKKL